MKQQALYWKTICWLLVLTAPTWAGVPETMHFSGNLDMSGGSFTGTTDLTLILYDDANAGTALWTETQAVSVTDGRFSVVLGDGTAIANSALDGKRYLGVTVQGDTEMTPRIELHSVPFARRAGDAGTLGGNAASAFVTPGSLGTVATSGSYADLTDEPWTLNPTSGTLENGASFTYGLEHVGPMRILGDNGLTNVWMGALNASPNSGQVTVNNAVGDSRVAIMASESGGGVLLAHGKNGLKNSALWYYGPTPDHGLLELFDDTDTARVALSVQAENAGQLVLHGPSGQKNVGLWYLSGSPNNGALHLYDDSDTSRASMAAGNENAGSLILTGQNGEMNAHLAHFTGHPNHGMLNLYDDTGTASVSLAAGTENAGSLTLKGANGEMNAQLGYYSGQPNHGTLTLKDDTGTARLRLSADSTDNLGKILLYGPNGLLNTRIANPTGQLNHASLIQYDSKEGIRTNLSVNDNGAGNLLLYGANGSMNIGLWNYSTSPNDGNIQLYNGNGSTRIRLDMYNDKGLLRLYGPNNEMNVYLSSSYDNADHGYVGVLDSKNGYKAAMYVDASGNGIMYANTKNFRMVHPNDAEKEIWYACIEGPEAAAYARGTAQLVNGQAQVTLPEHFEAVAAHEGITVSLTPQSAESKGLAVIRKSPSTFTVQELHTGQGTYAFDWEVKAVRIGYEDYQPVRPKQVIAAQAPVPSEESDSH